MRQILAIAKLTWKAAFRFRLFWVLAGLLLLSVVVLPLLIKDDGTARGFTQILLTYTLSLITALLGFSTLWLACGTLARDIEDCQMQMVAVKPVARWQIWLGKWFGLMLLNTALLALAGTSVFVLMQWRAQRLPVTEQNILRREILVARASVRPSYPDLDKTTDQIFREQLAARAIPAAEQPALRRTIRDQLEAGLSVVPPQYTRTWKVDFGRVAHRARGQPLALRFKFFSGNIRKGATYQGIWQAGVPPMTQVWRQAVRAPADSFQEVEIPAGYLDDLGALQLQFSNASDTTLLFRMEDGIEVLYPEGGFGLNFARGLGIILCWLAVLAALGLAAASFLSFPVAAFFSVSLLVVTLSSGTLSNVVEQGSLGGADHETGLVDRSPLDQVMVPLFRALLAVVSLVRDFSPVDALSTGRSITWGQLGLAWLQGAVVLGGVLALFGMVVFTRRELAASQPQS
jgi:hypothetical protein